LSISVKDMSTRKLFSRFKMAVKRNCRCFCWPTGLCTDIAHLESLWLHSNQSAVLISDTADIK